MAASQTPVVLVTGASKGVGLAVVKLLLQGTSRLPAANVVSISRSVPDSLKQLSPEAERTGLEVVQGDVNDEQVNKTAVDHAISKWGRLDAVVLCAGMLDIARLSDVTPASFTEQINTNLCSLITTMHYAVPHLRNSPTGCGKVVFVSSGAAVGNTAGWGAYNASKAAVNSVARTLANEEKGLAVWAIRPGVVATEMQGQIRTFGKQGMDESSYNRYTTLFAEGKLLRPEDPGHVLAALAVKGTRDDPKSSDGSSVGSGASGAFVDWTVAELEEYRMP